MENLILMSVELKYVASTKTEKLAVAMGKLQSMHSLTTGSSWILEFLSTTVSVWKEKI